MQQLELPGVSPVGHLHEVISWMLSYELECSPDTREMHASNGRNLCAFFGPDTNIRAIRYPDLRRYYEKEQLRGIARETIRKRLCTLQMAMKSAIRRDLMEKLPPWVVIKGDPRSKVGFWMLAQWEAAHAACDDEDFRMWIDCGWWLGSHTSDLNRFRWCDVDLWKKTWVRRNTKSRVEPVALPLPDRLRKILLERFGARQPYPRDLVCGRDMGHPNRALKELAHKAGVPRISPKGLRHSCETFLTESRADPFFRKTWLGHKSIKTQQEYQHVTDVILDQGISAINSR